jgi:hypothetical protein
MRTQILIAAATLLLLTALPHFDGLASTQVVAGSAGNAENPMGESRDVDTTPLNLGGGPDAFGYTWDETHTFNWIDIRGMSHTIEVEGLGADNVVGFFDISGMSPAFKYFWYDVDQFVVGDNGYISFSDKYLMAHPFQRPPSTRRPNDVLFCFVDDFTFVTDIGTDTGHVYYNWQDFGDTCIIQYHDVPFWGNVPGGCEGRNQFEILLIAKPDTQGVIVYQYNVQEGTGSGTRYVGWEDVTGKIGWNIPKTEAVPGVAIRIANTDPQNPEITDMAVVEAITGESRGFFVYRGDSVEICATVKNTGNQPVSGVVVNCTIMKGATEVYNADYGFGNYTPAQEKTRCWDDPYVCQDGTGTYTITVTQLVSDYNPTNDEVEVEMHVISLPTDMSYINEDLEGFWAWNGSNGGWGAHYCAPDSVPGDTLVVDEVSVNIGSGTVPCDIWVALMSEGMDGFPEDTLTDTTITITVLPEPTWFTLKVEPPEVFLENECFFAAYIHPGESNPYFGMDYDPPFSYQGWEYTGCWAEHRDNDNKDPAFTVHANPPTLPNVMVTCLPHQVKVPREKGTLDFRIVYENTTTLSQDEDWWLKVFKGGVQVRKMGPWFVELDPGELVEKEYSLNVPKNAPLSLFDFVVYTGTYDSYVDGECSFSFEVKTLGEQ